LIAPLCAGHAGPLTVLARVKAVGLAAWIIGAIAWGLAVGRARAPVWAKGAAVLVLALSVPVAAYAVSGMETALAMALATIAATLASPGEGRRHVARALLAGLTASLRPEMGAWALVIAIAFPLAAGERRAPRLLGLAGVAFAPFALCVLARLLIFGRPAPLALMAKPSDLAHGLSYAGAAAVVTLTPLLVIAPWALFRERGPALAIVVAGAIHLAVVAFVGGDWMPYARLAAPIAPSLAYAFVLLAPHARPGLHAARAAIVTALGIYFWASGGTAGRHVGADREALVHAARPYLDGARAVATLDIGWPSAATEATIVDLAGLTDPVIAALPGGHTSKRVDPGFLLSRDPDRLLLYTTAPPPSDWRDAVYPRVVEARLARSAIIAERFEPRAFVPLGSTGAGYVVLARRP
jgi:hypothetical protein